MIEIENDWILKTNKWFIDSKRNAINNFVVQLIFCLFLIINNYTECYNYFQLKYSL